VRHSLVIDEYPVLIPKRANVLKDIFQKGGTGWGRHLSQPRARGSYRGIFVRRDKSGQQVSFVRQESATGAI
jgi:hypothetical protein